MRDYEDFVRRKLERVPPTGIVGATCERDGLFDFQRILVDWALRLGRAAIFASTGLGKTRMQLAWAEQVALHTDKPVLILAPLSVAQQTANESLALGIGPMVGVVKDGSEVIRGVAINVCNYERLHRLDPTVFGGVVFDESSCVKSYTSKTLAQLKEAFSSTPFRLSATATPSPNDYVELGTQAELLGICSRAEMLAEYFVHDGGETQKWRLKGHARQAFWRFVASWAALVRSPADLGYDASAYQLPPLDVQTHVIAASEDAAREQGLLFVRPAAGLMEQRAARRSSMDERVRRCVDQVMAEPDEAWVVWCELNSEQTALAQCFGDACANIYGSLDIEEKESRMAQFLSGEKRVLLSKSSICGFGVNLQFAARMAFVGVSNSWEQYHQSVRRVWRFGQTRPVTVHLFASELEGNVAANLARKETDAQKMGEELSRETAAVVREQVTGQTRRSNVYEPRAFAAPAWLAKAPDDRGVKMTMAKARQLRADATELSQRHLAAKYDIARGTVRDILAGKIWKETA